MFRQLLEKVLQEDTFKCYMHVATSSLYITKDACQPQMDGFCIYGGYGAKQSGQRRSTPATMAEVRQWPTFNYASANLFLTQKQQKQLAKEHGKGKAVGGGQEEETKVTLLVLSNYAEDSAASFEIGPVCDSGTVWTQPMCVAKLHRRIVVDASSSSDPHDSSCSSSSDASDSSSRTNSDAFTSTATPTTTTSNGSESAVPIAPPAKKFRRQPKV